MGGLMRPTGRQPSGRTVKGLVTELLLFGAVGTHTGAAAAPTEKIAYHHDGTIRVMDANGRNPRVVADGKFAPSWSPDGAQLAFETPTGQIAVLNLDDGTLVELTDAGGWWPSWSPDGQRIAFGRDSDVYVMNVDGTATTRLTWNAQALGYVRWSPDGSKISFDCGNWHLCQVNADGTMLIGLTDHLPSGFNGAWSPDGSKLVFTSWQPEGGADLFIMNPDGTAVTRLTTGLNAYVPAWAPDGRRIVFRRQFGGPGYGLWVINVDGARW